jgi:hypothetical protein
VTHSGGKPHAVGDRGQRYEVTYLDPSDGKRHVFGWSNNLAGACNMEEAIVLHPTMADPIIRDRAAMT